MPGPVLSLRGVSKSFGPVQVLHGIDIDLHAGQVLALIGENGAGKSTTMKILAGYQPPTGGTILLDGQPATLSGLRAFEDAGIVLIHQEFNLAEQLTVEQNVFLGRELRRGLLLDKTRMRQLTRDYLDRLDCAVDPDTPVSKLSNSDKQMVEIAKALGRRARILIMDEPTAVLTGSEVDTLFAQIRVLRDAGTAVLFTSHKLGEVAAIADRVTVMRDGHVVRTDAARAMTEDDMATAMVGRDVSDLYPAKPGVAADAPMALRVAGLDVPGWASDIAFDLRAGEIVGIAGLIGSGRTEAMEGLCGLRPATTTRLEIAGNPVHVRSTQDALAHGLCYMTEDRKLRGLLLTKGMRDNLTLQALHRFGRVVIDRGAEDRALTQAIADFDIRAGNRDVAVGNLSGGNQQKLLLAKIMQSQPRVLIVDEPTRGIDIGTKQQIYAFLRRLAAEGRAIIVVSSELQEVIGLSDRVLVMRQGRIAATLADDDINEATILRHAIGVAAPQTRKAS
ncbi:sugar ABC transporter ATP-binding protein [Loktanella fryxellensis]|uniref:sugar ABC transporter ATP-binding protein n=1 Tax=Loktanella fryxellensis TaxID=245187 RepID=UPI0015A59D6C|nr:sugar ABC transporter ATP-binding protein [Loktanella fryxellensis]